MEKVNETESNVDVVISQLKGASRVRVAKEGIVRLWSLNVTLAPVKILKGTVSRDFLLQVFFMNHLPPSL